MPMVPHATKQDYNEALKGFHYPISRAAIINMGRDKGGIDREVARVLQALPDRRYRDEDEVRAAIRAIYLGNGVAEDDLPA